MNSSKMSRRRWLHVTGAAGLACVGAVSIPGAKCLAAPSDPSVLDVGTRRELFIDDLLVAELVGGATRRLHHPMPRDVALVHNAPWEGSGSVYHTVFRDGDRYRMYYRGSHLEVTQGRLNGQRHPEFTCYAESPDGIQWTKPKLGLFEFEGSKDNNIVWAGPGTHNFSPFRDENPACPSAARYKALGTGKGGLVAFQSSDAVHWSLMSENPVITHGAFDSQNLAFWDAEKGKYRAYWRYFTAGVTTEKEWKPSGVRAIRTAVSDDFQQWSNEADLTFVDSPAEELYTNQIMPYFRAPHIRIGLPTRYVDRGWSASARALPERENRELRASSSRRYGTAITECLLMASRDGVRFERWNEAFLRPGIERPGTWQYGQHYVACHAVETASALPGAPPELSLYSTEGFWHGNGSVLRRYTLRMDGFVSVHAPARGGELITKPLQFSGGRQLSLNFSSSAAGGIRVELQRPDGQPLPGYSLADCDELFGDTLDRRVTWRESSDVSALAGQPVRVRMVLRDADVYALQFVGN